MGEFNSDDHYIYYCGQESLRRNGVAIMVNKRVRNAVLRCNIKNDRTISVRFQGKPFNITVPYTKINSKWIKDLNVRPEATKLLEENIGRTLYDINQSKIIYDPPSRVMEIKTKVNKWDLINLKSF